MMLKHWKSVLHCNECTYWTGFVCSWHPGRRLLFYSMKQAVKSVVLAFSPFAKVGARVLGIVASISGGGEVSMRVFFQVICTIRRCVYACARCNQTQLKSSKVLLKTLQIPEPVV